MSCRFQVHFTSLTGLQGLESSNKSRPSTQHHTAYEKAQRLNLHPFDQSASDPEIGSGTQASTFYLKKSQIFKGELE